MSRPFVYIGSTMFISLLIYSYCGVYSAAAVFALSAVAAIPLFLFRKKHKIILKVFTCICALMFSSGIYTAKTVIEYVPSQLLCTDSVSTVSGTMTEYSNDYGNHYYTLKNITINGQKTSLKIIINSKYFVRSDIDDTLAFTVIGITSVEDTAAAMNRKSDGIYIKAYSKAAATHIEAENHSAAYYLDLIKNYISESLSINLNSSFSSAVDAMLTGNKSNLSRDVQMNFSYSGISHLFAVSGFHLTLWTSSIFMLLKNLPFKNKKIIRSTVSILFVLFFMALTGFTRSVVRAGIMQIIMFAGGFVRYKSDSLNSLFIALTVILSFNPFSVMSVSLQMSFFATLGIITLGGPMLSPIEKLKPKIRSKRLYSAISALYGTAVISTVASLFTVFISAFTFTYYSVAAPLTNILCMPAAQLVMPLSIIGLMFSQFPPVGRPANFLCNLIMKYIFSVTDFIAHESWAVIDAQSEIIIIFLAVITLALLLLLPVFYRKDKHLRRTVAICAVCFFALSAVAEFGEMNTHKITVCSVGNGTSIVYRAGRKNIVIGCGGSKYSDYILTNTVNKVNAREFDLLLIPRDTETESLYSYTLLSSYSFDNILVTNETVEVITEQILPPDTKRADEANIMIDEKTNLLYINNSSFSGIRISSDDFSCTVLFRPVSDFSVVPDEWQTGDLLITRQSLPDIDLSGFENIFISSDKDLIYDNENIYSTKTDGTLIYTSTLTGGEKIYADK